MSKADLVQFTQDFKIPISVSDVHNAFRLVCFRDRGGKQEATFENFTEILTEIFFVLETEQLINVVECDICNIDPRQAGAASEKIKMEKIICTLQTRERPKSASNDYLFMAHQFMETKDRNICLGKIKNKNGQQVFPQLPK